jgi:archaellum component FlaC
MGITVTTTEHLEAQSKRIKDLETQVEKTSYQLLSVRRSYNDQFARREEASRKVAEQQTVIDRLKRDVSCLESAMGPMSDEITRLRTVNATLSVKIQNREKLAAATGEDANRLRSELIASRSENAALTRKIADLEATKRSVNQTITGAVAALGGKTIEEINTEARRLHKLAYNLDRTGITPMEALREVGQMITAFQADRKVAAVDKQADRKNLSDLRKTVESLQDELAQAVRDRAHLDGIVARAREALSSPKSNQCNPSPAPNTGGLSESQVAAIRTSRQVDEVFRTMLGIPVHFR